MIGIPHPKWSERPLLIAVSDPKQPPSKDALLSFLKVRKLPQHTADLAVERHPSQDACGGV